jgi:GMP synthase (glutamine-hydrolysing)
MLPRLISAIQVQAIIRRAQLAGAHAFLLRRGQQEAGALFLKLSRLDGSFTILNQARRGDGELVWTRPLGDSADEPAVNAYLEKQLRFDPDLWILEIEDSQGRAFVDDPVV